MLLQIRQKASAVACGPSTRLPRRPPGRAPQRLRARAEATSRAPMSRSLALVMLGDVMLGRVVDQSLSALPTQHQGMWGDVLPLLRGGMATQPGEQQQLNAANLECAVTAEEQKDETRVFNFKLHPSNVPALRAAALDFVSLANNHCRDYREAGLQETQRVLGTAGIAFAGTGTAAAAALPAVVERGGLRVAFLSYADHYAEWAATADRPGINFIDPENPNREAVRQQLAQAAAAGADLVVVFVHWGPNWRWRPSAPIQRLAHDFIDCGADIVFGHSSHHIQGIEVYRHRPIVYGAGGFVDDYRLDEAYRNDLGFLYCCHISDGQPAWLELVPTRIRHKWQSPGQHPPYLSEVHLAHGKDAAWLHTTLRDLCAPWGTTIEKGRDSRLCIPLREHSDCGGIADGAA